MFVSPSVLLSWHLAEHLNGPGAAAAATVGVHGRIISTPSANNRVEFVPATFFARTRLVVVARVGDRATSPASIAVS